MKSLLRCLLLLSLLAAGCTAPQSTADRSAQGATSDPGSAADFAEPGSHEDRESGGDQPAADLQSGWSLREVTADGMVVAVSVFHGACDGYDGVELVGETADLIEILVRYGIGATSGGCDDIGLTDHELVTLAQPIGNRDLVGCGNEDCFAAEFGEAERPGPIAVSDDVVVFRIEQADSSEIQNRYQPDSVRADEGPPSGIVALDRADGTERWRINDTDRRFLEQPRALGDVILLLDQGSLDDVVAVDASSGEVRWEARGWEYSDNVAIGASTVLALLVPGRQVIEAWDPSGQIVWAAEPGGAIDDIAVDANIAIVLSGRNCCVGGDLGETTITAYALDNGRPLWSTTRGVQAYAAVIRPELGLVAVNTLGAIYGFSLADGSEVWRNVPLNVQGIASTGPDLISQNTNPGGPVMRIDPATGQVVGSVTPAGDVRDYDADRFPEIHGDRVVSLDQQLIRRDLATVPLTEQDPAAAWTVDVRARMSAPTIDEDLVFVATPLGARAFDVDTGELRWAFADFDR